MNTLATSRKPAETNKARRPPATTPEARENQLIGLAVDLAERQMLEGTASAQVITHYLKLASSREKMEKEKLLQEVEVLKSKNEALQANRGSEDMYKKALDAMRSYQGAPPLGEDYYE